MNKIWSLAIGMMAISTSLMAQETPARDTIPFNYKDNNNTQQTPAPRTYRTERRNQQPDQQAPVSGYDKSKLFLGGNLSLSFFNSQFLIGANPYVGYSFAPWLDAGALLNVQYYTYKNPDNENDGRYKNTLVGGGVFARIFPIPILFAQVQPEYNHVWQSISDFSGKTSDSYGAFSLLVGPGVRTQIGNGNSYTYISVLWDVAGNKNSPYNDYNGNPVPIVRVGVNIGL